MFDQNSSIVSIPDPNDDTEGKVADNRSLVPMINDDGTVTWVDPKEVAQERQTVYRIGVINGSQLDVIQALKPQIYEAIAKEYNIAPNYDTRQLDSLAATYPIGKLYLKAKMPDGQQSFIFLGDTASVIPLSSPKFTRSLMPSYDPKRLQTGPLCSSANALRPDTQHFVQDANGQIVHKNIPTGTYAFFKKDPSNYRNYLPAGSLHINFDYVTHACVGYQKGRQIPLCPFAQGAVALNEGGKPVKCDIQISFYFALKVVNSDVSDEPFWCLGQAFFAKSAYMAGSSLLNAFKTQTQLGHPVNYHLVTFGSQSAQSGYSLTAKLEPLGAKKYYESMHEESPEEADVEMAILGTLFEAAKDIQKSQEERAKAPVKPTRPLLPASNSTEDDESQLSDLW